MPHWFAHPWLLLTLVGLPLLAGLMLWGGARRRRALLQLGPRIARLDTLPRPRVWLRLRRLCVALGLLLLGLGAAGPQWGRDWGQSAAPGRDLMVVVDCSRSMLAETPTRLERARTALIDLVQAVRKQGGHRLGLVVFAGKAKLLCPLTHDYDHFRWALDKLEEMPFDPNLAPEAGEVSGTRIGLGLQEAIRCHAGPGEQRDILLLSDGDDPAHDGEWRGQSKTGESLLDEALKEHIAIYTVGVGDPDEAVPIRMDGQVQKYEGQEVLTRLEEEPLRQIASRTHGLYIPARTRALGQEYLNLVTGKAQREDSVDRVPVYQQRYPWFLLPAFGLLLLSVTLPEQSNRGRSLG